MTTGVCWYASVHGDQRKATWNETHQKFLCDWCLMLENKRAAEKSKAHRAKQDRALLESKPQNSGIVFLDETNPHRKLRPDEPHPVCRLAFADGATVCSRCSVLLHEDGCECEPCAKDRYESQMA